MAIGDLQESPAAARSVAVAAALPRPHGTGLAPGWLTFLLPPASAGLLYLCHFPVAWGQLAWLALVPLLLLVRSRRRPSLLYLGAALGGLVFYGCALSWMPVADPRMWFAWGVTTVYCALFWVMGLGLARFLDRRTALPPVVAVPVAWVALEYLRCHVGPGFSWYLVGYTQHDFLPIVQLADLAGVFGVSFLVVAVNALLAEILLARLGWLRRLVDADAGRMPTRLGLLTRALVLFVVLLAALAYGGWRLGQRDEEAGPRIALLQGNLDQRLRSQASNDSDPDQSKAIQSAADHYYRLCNLAAHYRPDLFVWPETSLPAEYTAIAPDVPPERVPRRWRDPRADGDLERDGDYITRTIIASHWCDWPHRPASVLVGINSTILEADREHRYNSALLVGPTGRVAGRYDKIHRVPLGEYVPLRESLPFLNYFAPYDFDYSISEGRDFTRFPLTFGDRSCTFGVVICYEDTVAEVNRPYGGGDGRTPADFVLNLSNDGWFDGSSEHLEHLAICRFRAVECRRAYARAVNMGVSAVIDGSGRVLRPVPGPEAEVWDVPTGADARELPVAEWGQFKKTQAVLLARLPLDRRVSVYARAGDWLPWGCWLLLGGCVAASWWRRRGEKRCPSNDPPAG